MGITSDALDVVLNVRNFRRFITEMKAANKEIRDSGKASRSAAAGHDANAAAAARSQKAHKAAVLAGKATAATLAIAVVASTKLSVNYERQMTLIQTQAGDTAANVAMYHDQVLKLAQDPLVTASPQNLAEGMYEFASVGLKGKRGLDALAVAAKGAAIANNDVKDVSQAMAGAWLAGIKGAGDLTNIMGVMNATVGAGAAQMDELVHAMGTGVLPAAKTAGLGMVDVMGALALFTDEGYKASSAAAQMSTALHFIYSPSDKASQALKSIGLSGSLLAEDMRKPRGLLVALRHLQENMQGMNDIEKADLMAKILPGGRGRILLVLMNQLDNYERKLNQIDRTTKDLGESQRVQAATAANKMRAAWGGLQVELIKFGDNAKSVTVPALILLIKVATWLVRGLRAITDAVVWLVEGYKSLPEPLKIVIELFATMAATAAVLWGITKVFFIMKTAVIAAKNAVLFWAFATKYAIMTNPIGLALVVLIAIIVVVIKHWGWFKKAAQDVFKWLKVNVWPTIRPLARPFIWLFHLIKDNWGDIKKWATDAMKVVVKIVGTYVKAVVSMWKWVFEQIAKVFRGIIAFYEKAKDLKEKVLGSSDKPKTGGQKAANKALGAYKAANPAIQGINLARKVLGFATGVEGFGGGMARINDGFLGETVYLPGGSSVQPSPASSMRKPRAHTPNPAPVSGGDTQELIAALSNMNWNVYLDGKQITARVSKHLSDKKARSGRGR